MFCRKCRRQHFKCFPLKTAPLLFLLRVCRSSHFLPLLFSTLSFSAALSLSPSLVYLLSQPRKSRDYQRNNPSGRGLLLPASAESLLFFPLLFPSVLSYFLSEAGGEDLMLGDIPLLVWRCKTSKHSSFPYSSVLGLKFILSTVLFPLQGLLCLSASIKPDP